MKRVCCFCTFIILTLTTFALARDVRLTASSVVPAAQGKVDIDKDQNGNFKIKLEIHHLAKPANLSPAATNYVVWIQARDKAPENQGLLKVNNDLDGKFETTTRYEAFDVFVTAENDPNASLPRGAEVLRGTVQP
jgi:hypothetical protein